MAKPSSPRISSRKEPSQDRSSQLVAAILEAAIRVLAEQGAHRFTTARVAERAGVSVGSLYQYFPNKESILFRLQIEEWERTSAVLCAILADKTLSPSERLRKLLLTFFESECEEAAFRLALDDAAPLYRDTPEAKALKEQGRKQFLSFLREAAPASSPRERALAATVMKMTMSAVGEQIATEARPQKEVEALANATADMVCAYLERLMKVVDTKGRQSVIARSETRKQSRKSSS